MSYIPHVTPPRVIFEALYPFDVNQLEELALLALDSRPCNSLHIHLLSLLVETITHIGLQSRRTTVFRDNYNLHSDISASKRTLE